MCSVPLCDAATCPPRHDVHLVVTISEALDGLARIATMLRQRGYDVQRLSADLGGSDLLSTVHCTVEVRQGDAELLTRRLERLCTVVSVRPA